MNNKIIIFGAGYNGRKLLKIMGKDNISYFTDNNQDLWGKQIGGISIIPPQRLKELSEYTIVLSVNNDAIRKQLENYEIEYYEYDGFWCVKNYLFNEPYYRKLIDDNIYQQYLHCTNDVCKEEKYEGNWYRNTFFNDLNKELVDSMRNDQTEKTFKIWKEMYAEQEIYFDEYFEHRPGMRLIAKILSEIANKEEKVCDVGCGSGRLLYEVSKSGVKCIGVDMNKVRIDRLHSMGIAGCIGNAANTTLEDESIDYLICQECLEHVIDPVPVVNEIKRILKKNGRAFITVPYLDKCDCDEHVRIFDKDNLYWLFYKNGFQVEKIFVTQYLNETYQDNIFMQVKK